VLHELIVCGFAISLSWTPLLDFWLKFLLIFFSPFFLGHKKRNPLPKETRQTLSHDAICSSVNGGLLIHLNPQVSISSDCHFAFQNA
jgi:hypothetical protein